MFSTHPSSTRFTFIEALKKHGLFLLLHLNSPFPPTVTDCSSFTYESQIVQFSVLTKTQLAFIQFSLIQEMAEGALSGVAKGIIGIAGKLALSEVALIWGVKDEINKLKETVSTIKAVLMDAEAKQHNSEAIKVWLQRLKDAMFDADDLLDEISTEALQREVMTRDKKAKKVRILFSKPNQPAYGVRMGHKVKKMRERLAAIAADRQFHLDERREEIQVRNESRRQTHSLVSAEDVIGREEDKKAIIGSLLDPNVKENVSVLPIVGIGGLGKTTVAQLVFNDKELRDHFEPKVWVCVSENFDVKIIVEKILECIKNKKPKDLEMNTLVNNLQKEINGKRYLLMLDDVWNENHEKWLSLKDILTGVLKWAVCGLNYQAQLFF